MPAFRSLACLCLLATATVAQASTITTERVREAVTWLASDERNGRDTGSVELAQAGDWLAERFANAKLSQVREGSWFHEFSMAGVRLDSDQVSLKLSCRVDKESKQFTLEAGKDVRQWLPSDGLKGEETCTVARITDPALRRLLRAGSARRPIIIEVPTDHAFWAKANGKHSVISSRRRSARPVLLVREGVLPEELSGSGYEWTATWSCAASEPEQVAQRNVMALLPASKDSVHKGEYVVVSAHYDHIGVGRAKDGDAIYNGADDNATGTTAVLLLAEAMAKMPAPKRNVLFVCFAAEERGLKGSYAFCKKPPVPLNKIVANLNIEMIGRPEEGNVGKAWVTGSGFSDFASICDAAMQKTGGSLVEFRMATQLFAQSDNLPFAKQGIVAHSISAGSLHDDYHGPGDEVDKLDIPHMTKIIRGLLDCTLELANRDQPPAWNDKGLRIVERLKKR